jgi:transposase
MLAVLDQLELIELVTSITGLSAVGAATIFAETGDPEQVRDRTRSGQTRRPGTAGEDQRHLHRPHELTGQGRPRLRLAAWRAVWGA